MEFVSLPIPFWAAKSWSMHFAAERRKEKKSFIPGHGFVLFDQCGQIERHLNLPFLFPGKRKNNQTQRYTIEP